MNWRSPSFLAVAAVTVVVLTAGAYFMLSRQPAPSIGSSAPAWKVDSGAPPQDLQQMEQAAKNAPSSRFSLPPDQGISLEGVKVSGDWAIAGGPIRNIKTGAIAEAEGLVVILRKVDGQWQAAYPATRDFEAWIDQVPDSLLSAETKKLLK